ncbi:hypothetical protein ASE92_02380 [Pedobacter sp. Leaf41]|jgi:hypothetical protein|uniref:hypothetical protein n=1 Tax=Pedobacter sp. Leaf41 TaxID=1736218 RepID=UPI00070372D9|nr:hypothetical protein [Pedobacter sp. Leaf41]KQN38301.1 hypothetical protein ASE92_02380 [Pedobacter sp. Leaf41]
MTTKEIIIVLVIYVILPLIGLLYSLMLIRQIKNEEILNAPIPELLMVFVTYGGLLLVVLTTLLWKWSGMASVGSLYLTLVAPIFMGLIAYRHRQTKTISKYHNWTYISGLLYFIIAPLTFGLLFLARKN